MKDIVDYNTNRFIFIGWNGNNCENCDYTIARLLDKHNRDEKIRYCYNCKLKEKNGTR